MSGLIKEFFSVLHCQIFFQRQLAVLLIGKSREKYFLIFGELYRHRYLFILIIGN